MSGQSGSSQSGNFPLDNLTFDLITILYEKSKGLEAYQKYIKDAKDNEEVRSIFEQLVQQDQQAIQQLQQQLATLLSNQGGASGTASSGSRTK